jgi:hypothetical protein
MAFIREEGTLIMPPIPMGAVLPGREVLTPAHSAGSIMAALQGPTHSKDDPVLAAFMEGAVEASVEVGAAASMVVEAVTAAEATDSSREVIKP